MSNIYGLKVLRRYGLFKKRKMKHFISYFIDKNIDLFGQNDMNISINTFNVLSENMYVVLNPYVNWLMSIMSTMIQI